MKCPACSLPNKDNTETCIICGAKLINNEQTQQYQLQEEPLTQGEPVVTPSQAAEKQSKKPGIIIALTLLLVAIFAGGIIAASALSGPMTYITKSLRKTVGSERFAFEAELSSPYSTINIEGTVVFNPNKRILELYAKSTVYDRYSQHIMHFYIKDGTLVIDENSRVSSEDISEYINTLFDEYDKYKSLDNHEELLNLLGIATDESFNELSFYRTAKDFIKNLNNPDYINQHIADYTKETRDGAIVYSFEFEAERLAEELISVFGKELGISDTKAAETNIRHFLYNNFGGERFNLHFKTTKGYLSGFMLDSENYYISIILFDFKKAEINEDLAEKYQNYIGS